MKVLTAAVATTSAFTAATMALLPLAMMSTMGTSDAAVTPVSGCTVNTTGLTVDELDDDQLANAGAILAMAIELKVPTKGQVIAIATALQESGLRNLDYGDRDSLGLFQQRPSQGWGTAVQIRTPSYAARAFFGGPTSPVPNTGLLSVPGWEDLEVWEAAQTVQRSAFPTAYAKWEGLANDVVSKLANAASSCAAIVVGDWTLPLQASAYSLTSGFGGRIHPISGQVSFHTGLDMAAPTGTSVYAATSGVVTWAGTSAGYGNLVRIQHASSVETYYGHLSQISVHEGQTVEAGTPIGAVGSTGNSTGPHLHFEVRYDGEPTDPEPFLREKGLNP